MLSIFIRRYNLNNNVFTLFISFHLLISTKNYSNYIHSGMFTLIIQIFMKSFNIRFYSAFSLMLFYLAVHSNLLHHYY